MVNYTTLRGRPHNAMEQARKPSNLARAHREIMCLLSELAGCLGKARCKSDSVHRALGRAEPYTHSITTIDIEYILNIYDNDARDIAAWRLRLREPIYT